VSTLLQSVLPREVDFGSAGAASYSPALLLSFPGETRMRERQTSSPNQSAGLHSAAQPPLQGWKWNVVVNLWLGATLLFFFAIRVLGSATAARFLHRIAAH
jgi:hypothetical protein